MQASCPGCTMLEGRADLRCEIGMRCYALCVGPRRDKDPRLVPVIVIKVRGTSCVQVRVSPYKTTWHRYAEQLHPRYCSGEEKERHSKPLGGSRCYEARRQGSKYPTAVKHRSRENRKRCNLT